MHILCESLSEADSPNVLGGEERTVVFISFFTWASNKEEYLLLLMVQKSGNHQLRLVVYHIIYDATINSRVCMEFRMPGAHHMG